MTLSLNFVPRIMFVCVLEEWYVSLMTSKCFFKGANYVTGTLSQPHLEKKKKKTHFRMNAVFEKKYFIFLPWFHDPYEVCSSHGIGL